ncbi:MAG: DUF86 domain-containing protein [Luteitalea sp.]|nr:DUF86 domain-containing protein [Luteitalea sp.]
MKKRTCVGSATSVSPRYVRRKTPRRTKTILCVALGSSGPSGSTDARQRKSTTEIPSDSHKTSRLCSARHSGISAKLTARLSIPGGSLASAEAQLLRPQTADAVHNLAGFRNLLVHDHARLDHARVHAFVQTRVASLRELSDRMAPAALRACISSARSRTVDQIARDVEQAAGGIGTSEKVLASVDIEVDLLVQEVCVAVRFDRYTGTEKAVLAAPKAATAVSDLQAPHGIMRIFIEIKHPGVDELDDEPGGP